jgi:peptidoglycan/xylan/chitin deacetylase (PgdA/CDA1 family)
MTILCYHSVDPNWDSPLAVSPSEFAGHCSWLVQRRTVLTLEDSVDRIDATARLPRGETAITFDDGFAGLYEHAFPLLTRSGLAATVFLVAETLTPQGRPVDWAPPGSGTLTRDEVLEMSEGGVRFGSHSYSHHDLTALGDDERERDLRESRVLLEDLLGRPVPFLAYPGGRHDERVQRSARRAGYTHAFTLPDRREAPGPYAIPRAGVYPGNGPRALRIKSSRWYLPVRTTSAFPAIRGALRGLSRAGSPRR